MTDDPRRHPITNQVMDFPTDGSHAAAEALSADAYYTALGDAPAEDADDDEVAPECPATADEHDPDEATSYPVDPSGRCEVFTVCTACGAALGHVGWDGVL